MTLDGFIRRVLLGQRAAREGGMDRRVFIRSCLIAGAAIPFISPVTLFQPRWSNADLIRRLASTDLTEALAAREAFAAFITAPILQVIEQAPVISELFSTATFDSAGPTIPLDLGSWDDEVLLGGVTDIRSPGVVPVHNTWCHGWPRRSTLVA